MRESLRRLLAGATLAWALAAHAAPGDELRRLVEQGRSAQAYRLGAQHPELRGTPQFDYYFGVAASDAGHAGEGVLALGRVLVRRPRDSSARMQLARGYLALGGDVRARREFEHALECGPPADLGIVIRSYLDLIRLRQSRGRDSARLYLEAGTGVDTNVNADEAGGGIWLPVLGNVGVVPGGARRRDGFASFAAGGEASHPLARGAALFGGFALDSKNNDSARELDLFRSGLAAGASFTCGRDQIRLALARSALRAGGARLRSLTDLDGEWSRTPDELSGVRIAAQWANEDYTGVNAPRKADYAALGLDYRQLFIADWRPVQVLGASVGSEHNTENRPDLGRGLVGLRMGFELTPQLRWGLSAGLAYVESRYDGPDPLLGTTRRDHYAQFDPAASYLLDRSWSMRGELTLADNRSSLEADHYTRELAAPSLRYEFNQAVAGLPWRPANDPERAMERQDASVTIKVWDMPVRLLHWLLVALVAVSVSTGYLGGNLMRWHVWSGCAILGLLIFRLLWGFAGSTTARFAHFVRGPRAALGYARGLLARAPSHSAGHNPLGGWMVLALLASAALQACTGLFANDDIATEGPLYHLVSKTTSDSISAVHQANAVVLLSLIGLHVAAVLYYLWYKREDLLRPMLTGLKRMPAQPLGALRFAGALRAAALAALAAAALVAILNF